MNEFELQLGEPLDGFIGDPFQPADFQQDAPDLASLFSEPRADPNPANITEDTRTASSSGDPVCFCRNPQDGVTYLFDSNTRTAYPLHPNMAAVVYASGRNLPYPKIRADQVSKVFADGRRKPREDYQTTPSGLMLPPFSGGVREPPPVEANPPVSTPQLNTTPGGVLCVGRGADVGSDPDPLTLSLPVGTGASGPQLIGLNPPAQSSPREPPPKPQVQQRESRAALSRYRRMNFDPSKVYPLLPSTPPPWGQFTYFRTGELIPHLLSVTQIIDFLYLHPLHYNESGIRDPKNSGLEIFIQLAPYDCAHRYPLPTSSLCRFNECLANKNKIGIGHFRVCFSEKRTTGLHDPYHNAGYVHLFCMENFLNFPQLVLDLDVKADTRKFERELQTRGPSPMGLDRTVKATAEGFIADCQRDYPPYYPLPGDIVMGTHEGTLTHRLHLAKLQDGYPSQRGGSANELHLGNLRNIPVAKASQRQGPPLLTLPEPQRAPELATQPAPQPAPQPTPQFPLLPPPPRKRGRPRLVRPEPTPPTKSRKIAETAPDLPPPDPAHKASDTLLAMQESIL
ncbi:MAG: hypothetical protein M1839_004265 [Geoglossum umbratile]|nr:MAG: hypothetical protein M1839_004265 [Geoglossum umbratile]